MIIELDGTFTTDERADGNVSIALGLTGEPDELWRRTFREHLEHRASDGGQVPPLLGTSFPFTYDETHKLEVRTRDTGVDEALDEVTAVIAEVNTEQSRDDKATPKVPGPSHARVQAWFDRR